jgi:hypothetical protein
MRGKGRIDLAIGAGLMVAGVLGGFSVSRGFDWLRQQMDVPAKAGGVAWAACALAVIYGGFRAVKGIERLVFGARAEGAVDDLEE